ncbi:transposase [Streptomyces mirabilis]|uniref:IS110 family transposase n=1 Tax=Streptomyces mirabilis TaxID=68239 RepID=UPI0036DEB52F
MLRAGVECTGSYGAGLARYLATQRVPVVEVNQPDRSARRRRGKTDAVDAESAARAALSGTARALPKTATGR